MYDRLNTGIDLMVLGERGKTRIDFVCLLLPSVVDQVISAVVEVN